MYRDTLKVYQYNQTTFSPNRSVIYFLIRDILYTYPWIFFVIIDMFLQSARISTVIVLSVKRTRSMSQ